MDCSSRREWANNLGRKHQQQDWLLPSSRECEEKYNIWWVKERDGKNDIRKDDEDDEGEKKVFF